MKTSSIMVIMQISGEAIETEVQKCLRLKTIDPSYSFNLRACKRITTAKLVVPYLKKRNQRESEQPKTV
jgi:hypothetical protein